MFSICVYIETIVTNDFHISKTIISTEDTTICLKWLIESTISSKPIIRAYVYVRTCVIKRKKKRIILFDFNSLVEARLFFFLITSFDLSDQICNREICFSNQSALRKNSHNCLYTL